MIEEWCYEQMALAASAHAFCWSKWNGDTQEKEKILFQGSETLQDEPLLEVSGPISLSSDKKNPDLLLVVVMTIH